MSRLWYLVLLQILQHTPCNAICGKNEVQLLCADRCPVSCHPGHCVAAVCYGYCNCLGGYVRVNKYSGPCVLPSECGRYANFTQKTQTAARSKPNPRTKTRSPKQHRRKKISTKRPQTKEELLHESLFLAMMKKMNPARSRAVKPRAKSVLKKTTTQLPQQQQDAELLYDTMYIDPAILKELEDMNLPAYT